MYRYVVKLYYILTRCFYLYLKSNVFRFNVNNNNILQRNQTEIFVDKYIISDRYIYIYILVSDYLKVEVITSVGGLIKCIKY